jgi:hypothetical protein
MTTLGDVLKGVRETIALNERVELLAQKVDQMDQRERDLFERVVRIETFIDLMRPAITGRALPPGGD